MLELPEDPLKVMSMVGALCSDLGLHGRALDILLPLADLRDRDPNALVTLALAQSRGGDEPGALRTLEEALMHDSGHDMARVTLAIHLQSTDPVKAQSLLSAVLSNGSDEDALALAYAVRGDILGLDPSRHASADRRLRYTRVSTGT